MDGAGDAGTDLSGREVEVARLGGLTEEARGAVRMLARPVAPVRPGGGMVVEECRPLLRGAVRLESRAADCCGITGGGEGSCFQPKHYCDPKARATGVVSKEPEMN